MMILTHTIGLPHFLICFSYPLQLFSSGHEINDISFGTHPWQIVHFPISFGGFGFQDFSVRAVTSFVIPFAGAILTRSTQPYVHMYSVCPFVSFTHYLFLLEEGSLQEDTVLTSSLCMPSLLTVE
jgi:hypothetical protein